MNEQQTQPLPTSSQTERKRRKWFSYILYFAMGLLIAMGIRTVVEPTIVVGESMLPNLEEGQYLLNLKMAYKWDQPDYGDVVIVDTLDVNQNHRYLIKRVIGLPGDTIEIKDNILYRNGKAIQEDYILEPMEDNLDIQVTLGKNEVWVMGDNRNHSTDSRVIGPLDYTKDVRGKVILRLIPFDQSFQREIHG